MPEITVAMIESANTKLQPFSVKQQEVELAIDGDTDPNTLQRLRDHVFSSVSHHRTVINKFIQEKNEEIKKAPNKSKAEQLTKTHSGGLEKLLRLAEGKIQDSAQKFWDKDDDLKTEYQLGKIKLTIKLLWVPVTFLGGALAFGLSPATGAAGWPLALKFWVDTVKDFSSWIGNVKEAYEAAQTDLDQLEKAIQVIRAIKPPKTIQRVQIDQLKIKSKAYAARILGLEMEVKEAGKKLDNLLQAQDKVAEEIKKTKKKPPAKAIKDMEDLVKDQIALVEKLNKIIDQGKKRVQSAKDHADNAEKRAKEDWSGWIGKLGKLYELCSSGLDISQDLRVTSENAFTTFKYLGGLAIDQFD